MINIFINLNDSLIEEKYTIEFIKETIRNIQPLKILKHKRPFFLIVAIKLSDFYILSSLGIIMLYPVRH